MVWRQSETKPVRPRSVPYVRPAKSALELMQVSHLCWSFLEGGNGGNKQQAVCVRKNLLRLQQLEVIKHSCTIGGRLPLSGRNLLRWLLRLSGRDLLSLLLHFRHLPGRRDDVRSEEVALEYHYSWCHGQSNMRRKMKMQCRQCYNLHCWAVQCSETVRT